jgi:hypothetical protein
MRIRDVPVENKVFEAKKKKEQQIAIKTNEEQRVEGPTENECIPQS